MSILFRPCYRFGSLARSYSTVTNKAQTGFNKPYALSKPLAALVGTNQLSRPQTVKALWDYIKSHDLQDPDDKRFIQCDDAMESVFHTKRLHMFTMNKLLSEHLNNVGET